MMKKRPVFLEFSELEARVCRTLETLIRSLDFILIDSILIINRQHIWVCGDGGSGSKDMIGDGAVSEIG